jgi:hypothetical protein
MGDCKTFTSVALGGWVEEHPGRYCIIGDCAYTPTEHLDAIFRGVNALLQMINNCNFFASQLRIRMEMAFGLLVKKWGILARPLTIKLKNIKRMVVAIAKLHNFCINKRILANCAQQAQQPQRDDQMIFTPTNVAFNFHEAMLRDESALEQFNEISEGYKNECLNNRNRMVGENESLKLTCPGVRSR